MTQVNERVKDSAKVLEEIKTYIKGKEFDTILCDWLDIFEPATWNDLKSDILTLCTFEDEFCQTEYVPRNCDSSSPNYQWHKGNAVDALERSGMVLTAASAGTRLCTEEHIADSYPMQWLELLFSALGMQNPLVELMVICRKILSSMDKEIERLKSKLQSNEERSRSYIDELEARLEKTAQLLERERRRRQSHPRRRSKAVNEETAFVQEGDLDDVKCIYNDGWTTSRSILSWNRSVGTTQFFGDRRTPSPTISRIHTSTTDTGDAATQTETFESLPNKRATMSSEVKALQKQTQTNHDRREGRRKRVGHWWRKNWLSVIGYSFILTSLYYATLFFAWTYRDSRGVNSVYYHQAEELKIGFWQSLVDRLIIYLLTADE